MSRPNPAVGALVMRDGIVVGRGWTQAGGRPHAEAMALAQAGEMARGATLYVTLEPCAHRSGRGPACADLIAQSGVAAVVGALEDPDQRTAGAGYARIAEAGIEVRHIASYEADRSLAGYFAQQRLGRPHVTLKLATSLDGCIALTSGESRWITGPIARAHVHSRRALSDAILVGGGTWRADEPRLDVRLPGLENRTPEQLILTRSDAPDGAKAVASPEAVRDLPDVQYLYVEGGARTAAAFLAADLIDRLELYRAPILIGNGKPALGDIGLDSLDEAHGRWRLAESAQLGSDRFEAYQRIRED